MNKADEQKVLRGMPLWWKGNIYQVQDIGTGSAENYWFTLRGYEEGAEPFTVSAVECEL